MPAHLPTGFHARAARDEDAQPIADLLNAYCVAFGDVPDSDAQSVREDWDLPRFNRDTDTMLVLDDAERIVGYEWVARPEASIHVDLDGYVHPHVQGRGIGTFLLHWGEARAHELIADLAPETPATLRLGSIAGDEGSVQFFASEGFAVIRHFWRMEIQMDEPPPAPVVPAGIAIRTLVPGADDHAAYQAVEESFADHWGHEPESFERWQERVVRSEGFTPSLSFLALEGDQVAGVTLGRTRGESGWVRTVGVRRPWRRRGLAMALLLSAFQAYYQRGIRVVGLGVDAESLTGATRLYERAGMSIRTRYDLYEKMARRADLAEGREAAVAQSDR